jgi:hypothetical protein
MDANWNEKSDPMAYVLLHLLPKTSVSMTNLFLPLVHRTLFQTLSCEVSLAFSIASSESLLDAQILTGGLKLRGKTGLPSVVRLCGIFPAQQFAF